MQVPVTAISLQTTISPVLTLIGLFLLIALAAWSYRWTRPPMPAWGRTLLAILRGAALLVVWLMLAGFEVHWSHEAPRKSRVALLLDRSASMAFHDPGGSREEKVKMILGDPVWDIVAEKARVERFTFSEALKQWPDAKQIPPAEGAVTDISSALAALEKIPKGIPDIVVLLSDGAANRGGSPVEAARKLGVPILAVAVGDSLPVRDVLVEAVQGTDITYANENARLDVTIRGTGVAGETVAVRALGDDGKVLVEDSVRFGEDWSETTIPLEFVPQRAGFRDITVSVSKLAGEATQQNNSRHIVLRVADRRRRVLLLAGNPSPDAGFLARTLEEDDDTEPVVIIGGGVGGKLLRGNVEMVDSLGKTDAAVLFLEKPLGGKVRAVFRKVAASELPLAIILGDNPDKKILSALESRIGESRPAKPMREAVLDPVREHPIFTIDGKWFEDDNRPPPPLKMPPLIPESGKMLTLAVDGASQRPAVTVSTGSPRTLVFFAGGLWRWDLARRPFDPGGKGYHSLWDRVLRWLTAGDVEERISLKPLRDVFTGGEEIELSAQVLDEALRPLDDARVTADVTHGDATRTISFQSVGDGRFIARTAAWGEGEYAVYGLIETAGERFEREIEFVVDPFHLEDAELRMRPELLRAMAVVNGGAFFTAERISGLPERIPEAEGYETIRGAWKPFGRWFALLALAALLSLEWVIRTRTGMV